MELQTISQVSRRFGISTRTLRYYEQIGLINPTKKEDFAYRVYDADTVSRLRQIIVLRKLRIPLRQIGEILESGEASVAIDAFERSLAEIEDEMTALSTIRSVIRSFVRQLNVVDARLALLDDESLLEIVDSLTASKINFKEEKSMDDLNRASEKLDKLTDVRIIYLPPMTVAAASGIGENSEGKAGELIDRFVRENDLLRLKPDIRHFGFDCSAGQTGIGEGSVKYQMWVSIPQDLEVPEPLVKRRFAGGLYAAHAIKMGDFEHWRHLGDWVRASPQYEPDWGDLRCTPWEEDMDRCLEEQLNFRGNMLNPNFQHKDMQLDLLYPIRERTS